MVTEEELDKEIENAPEDDRHYRFAGSSDEMPEESEIPNPKAQALAHFHAGEFKESDHPRKGDGKFGSGGGGAKNVTDEVDIDLSELPDKETFRKHFDVKDASEQAKKAVKALPKAQYEAVQSWISDAASIRRADKGKSVSAQEMVDHAAFIEGVKSLPSHRGPIFRGMSLSPKEADRIISDKHTTIDSVSSWSTDPGIASAFATHHSPSEGRVKIVMHIQAQTARSIEGAENDGGQKEAVLLKNTQIKFTKFQKTKDGVLIFHGEQA